MTKRKWIGMILVLIGMVIFSFPVIISSPFVLIETVFNPFNAVGSFENELPPGQYYTVYDEKTGKIVDKTSMGVFVGDTIIDENNKTYKVTKVKGHKAYAKDQGLDKSIVWKKEWDQIPASTKKGILPVQGSAKPQIAIYHTHSDESYVPTDGKEAIPARGGIFKVGSSLVKHLQNQGITALQDTTPHDPHDANAYQRSRRTALKLLKKGPVALIDVHRDGVPDPNFYKEQLDGKNITKVRLVVGRQNARMSSNLQFAKDIKAYMDKKKPGLIRGIFIAKGNYNQDLGPRALLVEVGTHTNSRAAAEEGAAVFAEELPKMLNLSEATPKGPLNRLTKPTKEIGAGGGGGAWRALVWIIGLLVIGSGAFLLISTGSIKGSIDKIRQFGGAEFTNYLGMKKKEEEVLQKEKEENKK